MISKYRFDIAGSIIISKQNLTIALCRVHQKTHIAQLHTFGSATEIIASIDAATDGMYSRCTRFFCGSSKIEVPAFVQHKLN